jgi:hypothetical protein
MQGFHKETRKKKRKKKVHKSFVYTYAFYPHANQKREMWTFVKQIPFTRITKTLTTYYLPAEKKIGGKKKKKKFTGFNKRNRRNKRKKESSQKWVCPSIFSRATCAPS